jgi:hypothetical protein
MSSALALLDDFPAYAGVLLKIKEREGGRIAPLKLNRAQTLIFQEIQRQHSEGVPAKLAILKARRVGASTGVAGIFSHRVFTRPYQRGMVIAHKGEESSKLFGIYERMYDHLPATYEGIPVKPKRTGGRGKRLMFSGMDSSLEVSNAGSEEAGRGGEAQLLHLSECGFYPYPEDFLQGLLPGFHKVGDGILILESTAPKFDDWWEKVWRAARDGENGFAAMFFPWYDEPSFRMPFAIEDEEWTDEEVSLNERFAVDGYQIAWLREVEDTDFQGNSDRRRKEYPATPEEAFTAIGDRVWSQEVLNACYRREEPLYEAHISTTRGIVQGPKGPLLVWEPPVDDPAVKYVVGADPAAGIGGDLSAATVWRVSRRPGVWPIQVAEFTIHEDPVTWAGSIARLGLWYNRALLACEVNGVGYGVQAALQKQLHYPNLHRWAKFDHFKISGDVWGWETTWKSKQIMLGLADWLFRTGKVTIRSPFLIEELMAFQLLDSDGEREQYEGVRGDDRIMASFIAWVSWFQHIYPGIPLSQLREQLASLYGSKRKLSLREPGEEAEHVEDSDWMKRIMGKRAELGGDW